MPQSDIGYASRFQHLEVTQLDVMHFNNCTAENFNVSNVVCGKNVSHVFGGNSKLTIKTSNIVWDEEEVELTENAEVV